MKKGRERGKTDRCKGRKEGRKRKDIIKVKKGRKVGNKKGEFG